MNVNIIAVTLSFLKLNEISNILKEIDNNSLKEIVILNLAYIHNTNYFNINGKINNYQNRCGQCNSDLIGDYWTRIAFNNCSICGENKKFNIDLCTNCVGSKSVRGEMIHKYCKGGHTILYLGVNILSY